MFRCASSAASDPPLGFSDHSSDISGLSGAYPDGLRQQCVGRSSDLPNAPPSVGAACSCTADFQFEALRPITDALISLHWLRIPERIRYKVAVLTYKVLHGSAPQYLGQLVRVADLPGRHALRSASTNRLVVPSVKLSIVGSRAFPVAGPQVWNGLPEEVTSAQSLSIFCQRLKTFLFQFSFPTS